MPLIFDAFHRNLVHVRDQVARACAEAGRPAGSVTILPVTKNHPAAVVRLVAQAGLGSVGENRVQEAREKKRQLDGIEGMRWELVGTLQSNKANLAAGIFDRIQSVDSKKLLSLLDRAAAKLGRVLPVLIQVNAGEDPAKHGCAPADAQSLAEQALTCGNLRLDGLMTIAPLDDNPVVARRAFARLRSIRDRLAESLGVPLPELSMGMTADLREAIVEGSTMVRIGTALFGPRESEHLS